jgi:hypothetical protein
MQTPVTRVRRRAGVSIIELMLALMAVMVLAGLAWKASKSALSVANNSRVTAEIGKLNDAMEAFAMRFGEYPPDFHDTNAVWKFLKTRFPKCPWQKYPDFCNYGPAAALYFWLGGPEGRGFSTNPANPFDNNPSRIGPFFKFVPDQLKRIEGITYYYPPRGIEGAPYVYFRGGPKGYDTHPGYPPARPYRNSKSGDWINAKTYQILSPGADGKYGGGNHFPSGIDYDDANMDDMANFTQGDTLGGAKPRLP